MGVRVSTVCGIGSIYTGQNQASQSLELGSQVVVTIQWGCCGLNSGPQQEQQVLLNAEKSLQFLIFYFFWLHLSYVMEK